jgi:hypothetical protein
VQLSPIDLTEEQEALRDLGEAKAKKQRVHPRSWVLDDFQRDGRIRIEKDDIVIQVVHEGNGKYLIDAPGNVLHVESSVNMHRRKDSFIFLELPKRRRRSLPSLAKKLGCTHKVLQHDGMLRDRSFAQRLVRELSGVTL